MELAGLSISASSCRRSTTEFRLHLNAFDNSMRTIGIVFTSPESKVRNSYIYIYTGDLKDAVRTEKSAILFSASTRQSVIILWRPKPVSPTSLLHHHSHMTTSLDA